MDLLSHGVKRHTCMRIYHIIYIQILIEMLSYKIDLVQTFQHYPSQDYMCATVPGPQSKPKKSYLRTETKIKLNPDTVCC